MFIPLNFATSFFGMNIRQLHSGATGIEYFILTALLASLVSFALSKGHSSIGRILRENQSPVWPGDDHDIDNMSTLELLQGSRFWQRTLPYRERDANGLIFLQEWRKSIRRWCLGQLLRIWENMKPIRSKNNGGDEEIAEPTEPSRDSDTRELENVRDSASEA